MSGSITEEKLLNILKDIPKSKHKAVTCALIGHTRFLKRGFMGYQLCARCEDTIGDSLGGAFRGVGCADAMCKCDACYEAIKHFTWKDYFLVPKRLTIKKAEV